MERNSEAEYTSKREAVLDNKEGEKLVKKVKTKPWVAHNSESTITCTENGVHLIDKEVAVGKTYVVCAGTYCINDIESRSEIDITFPAKQVVNKHKNDETYLLPHGNYGSFNRSSTSSNFSPELSEAPSESMITTLHSAPPATKRRKGPPPLPPCSRPPSLSPYDPTPSCIHEVCQKPMVSSSIAFAAIADNPSTTTKPRSSAARC